MGTTDLTAFDNNSSWFHPNQLTLVYNGDLGEVGEDWSEVTFYLDTPFLYEGGNIVIMGYLEYMPGWHQLFWNVETNLPEDRAIFHYSQQPLDPLNPPAQWISAENYRNVMQFWMEPAGTTGNISGVVTDEDLQPIADVEILLHEENRIALTNSAGVYSFNHVPAGLNTFTAKAHGYIDHTFEYTIIENQNHVQNFSLSLLPTVNVTGMLITSDTNEPLSDAIISLEGYENYYDFTSDENGLFTITNVYINKTYTLTIEKDGFQNYVDDSIVVNENDLNLGTITIWEKAGPPRRVTLDGSEDAARISWLVPGGIDKYFTHVVDQHPNTGVGFGGYQYSYEPLQRFTPEHLEVMGVAGAKLTSISFMTGDGQGGSNLQEVRLRAYKGGSGSPLMAGTRVLDQLVPSNLIVKGPHFDNTIWNEIELLTPIDIPVTEEFWFGLFYDSSGAPQIVALEPDNWTDGVGNVVGYSTYYTTWYQMSDNTVTGNSMIRGFAEGATGRIMIGNIPTEPISIAHYPNELNNIVTTYDSNVPRFSHDLYPLKIRDREPNRELTGYNIYRTIAANLYNEELWDIVATNISGTDIGDDTLEYYDPYWGPLPLGSYYYLIKAVYTNNNISIPSLSNRWDKETVQELLPPQNVIATSQGNSALVTWEAPVEPISLSATKYNSTNTRNTPTGYTLYRATEENLENPEEYTEIATNIPELEYTDNSWNNALPAGGYFYLVKAIYGEAPIGESILTSSNMISRIYNPVNDLAHTQQNSNITLTWSIPIGSTVDPSGYRIFRNNEADPLVEIQAELTYLDEDIQVGVYIYRVHALYGNNESSGEEIEVNITDIKDEFNLPEITALKGNYPNPFNPSTTIYFDIASDSDVKIEIYNIKGQKVITLLDKSFRPGKHSIEWNGNDEKGNNVSSGIYFYKMTTTDYLSIKRMMMIK